MTAPSGYDQPVRKKPSYAWLWIIAGIFLVCGCGGLVSLGAILFPVFERARMAATRTRCMSNVKQIATAELMYATDWDDTLPKATAWIDQTEKYIGANERTYSCPAVLRTAKQYGYATAQALGGKKTIDIRVPAGEVLIFETTDLVRNAASNPKTSPAPNRHGQGRTQAFVDGHASYFRGSESSP